MQKLKKYKIIAVIFAVIVIPLVYSFFYLDAFWDPYSKLESLPVAVVNQDSGATINGESRNIGNEITDNLKTDKNLKWVITSADDAKEGLENRRYYASIYIPSDFSIRISSVTDSEKLKGTLVYNVNEKRNYLASQVLSRVTLEFKDKISQNIQKEIVGTLLEQLEDVPSSLKELDDGLKKLNDGSETLYSKTGELLDGQQKFNDGVKVLNNGLQSASVGSVNLKQGVDKLGAGVDLFHQSLTKVSSKVSQLTQGSSEFSSGLQSMNDGLNKLNSGAGQLAQASDELNKGTASYNQNMQAFTTGLTKYIDSVNEATEAQTNIAKLITQYTAEHPEAMKDQNIQAVLKTLQATQNVPDQIKKVGDTLDTSGKELAAGAALISEGAEKLDSGMGSLTNNIGLLATGADKLGSSYSQIDGGIKTAAESIKTASEKAKELSDGTAAIRTGAAALSSGISKASSGSMQLSENSTKLYDGEKKLYNGIGELKDGISKASEGVSSSVLKADDKLNNIDGLKEYIAQPIELSENKVYGIPDYGTAFTPYFVSLSLWVGALLMFFAIYLDPEVKFRRRSGKSKGLLRFASYSFIGIAQALVLDAIILNALHLQVKNIGLFVLVSIVISLCFTSIMRFLLVQLRDVGKFLAVLLLILQLTSCGGTFPMELVPDFFNVLNPFMPMTYSVNALKEVISGIDYSYLTQNLVVLGLIGLSFLIINLVLSKIRLGKLLSDSKENDENDDNNLPDDAYVEA